MTDDKLRERLLKILRLARQGVGGEAANAEVLLEKLMRQHNVTLDMLENGTEAKSTIWFRCRNNDEKGILLGLVHRLLGSDVQVWRKPGSGMAGYLGVDVTPKEHAELLVHWEVYESAWHKLVSDTQVAFMMKHRLYDTTLKGRDWDQLSEQEKRDYYRRKALSNEFENVAAPVKRIPEG